VREIRTLRSTWRGLETRHGRDIVTLAGAAFVGGGFRTPALVTVDSSELAGIRLTIPETLLATADEVIHRRRSAPDPAGGVAAMRAPRMSDPASGGLAHPPDEGSPAAPARAGGGASVGGRHTAGGNTPALEGDPVPLQPPPR
jgi:hypothetical protein